MFETCEKCGERFLGWCLPCTPRAFKHGSGRPGRVYFARAASPIGCVDLGLHAERALQESGIGVHVGMLVKVGFTAESDVESYVNALRSPFPLVVERTIVGGKRDESRLHHRLAKYRLFREWSVLTTEQVAFIELERDRVDETRKGETAKRKKDRDGRTFWIGWELVCRTMTLKELGKRAAAAGVAIYHQPITLEWDGRSPAVTRPAYYARVMADSEDEAKAKIAEFYGDLGMAVVWRVVAKHRWRCSDELDREVYRLWRLSAQGAA